MTKQNVLILRRFRVLTGPERKAAVRAFLASHGVRMETEVQYLSEEHKALCAAVAKAVSYRKPITQPLSVGAAYFVYLQRDVKD